MAREALHSDEPRPADPVWHVRSCDCPCHQGSEVFHIVDCCGSVLGRRRTRESLVSPAATDAAVNGERRELR
jgi:hypothetical protein